MTVIWLDTRWPRPEAYQLANEAYKFQPANKVAWLKLIDLATSLVANIVHREREKCKMATLTTSVDSL